MRRAPSQCLCEEGQPGTGAWRYCFAGGLEEHGMTLALRELWRTEEGTATVEYAILLAVIVAASVGAWQGLSNTIKNMLEQCTAQVGNPGA